MFVRAAATANQRSQRISRTEYATSIRMFEKCTRYSATCMLTATSFRRFHLRSKIPANRQQPDERSPHAPPEAGGVVWLDFGAPAMFGDPDRLVLRSEEHTSELQSLAYLVCRLLLEKKKTTCPR